MRHSTAKSRFFPLICSLAAISLACSGSSDDGDDITTQRDGGTTDQRDAGDQGTRDGGVRDSGVGRDGGTSNTPDSGCTIEDPGDLTPDPACGAPGAWTVTVSGEVRDENGAPADGALAFICLTDARTDFSTCLRPRPTCSDGRFEVLVEESFRCSHHIVSRVATTGPGYAYSYCDIPNGAVMLDVMDPIDLVPTEPPMTLPPEGDRDMERTVVFSDGLELDVTPSGFFATYADISGTRVPQADVCTLASSPVNWEGIYAFHPEINLPAGGFPVRIPNTTGLAAGSTVVLAVLGGLSCTVERQGMDDYQVGESEWYEFGTGTVSMDGATIEGDNLPCFGWLAYRPM